VVLELPRFPSSEPGLGYGSAQSTVVVYQRKMTMIRPAHSSAAR
jgi:hypothetical protein